MSQPNMALAEQKRLGKLLSNEKKLAKAGAKFYGKAPEYLLALDAKSRICLAAQYMAYEEIRRAHPKPAYIAFARDKLSKEDWCEKTVLEATGGMPVDQVIVFKGIYSLYYVLRKDMELRLSALQETVAAKAGKH
ncbi:MAG: hypothetical protein HYS18_09000 [Burkholderiales bacterium]|nr:hypothetical protein [Burkholderiales bacterium]